MKLRLCFTHRSEKLAGEEGFEPSLTGPEPAVLPLDYSPATPQNRTGIGRKIQSMAASNR